MKGRELASTPCTKGVKLLPNAVLNISKLHLIKAKNPIK